MRNLVVAAAQVGVVNVRLPAATAVTVAPAEGIAVTTVSRGKDVWSLVIETPDITPVGARFSLALTVTRGGAFETLPALLTTRLTPLCHLTDEPAKRQEAPKAPDLDSMWRSPRN
ncbi:MAG TPA: hypothetical protein VM223_19600 [Planctomycetota bacterium]|nr:hypothetical protein [Planctomycetota bacterium]